MKARVKTTLDKISMLEKTEIMRINKIWMIALHERLNYGEKGLLGIYGDVCKMAEKLYEDPEYWMQVDDLLCDKYGFKDFMPKENLNEREELARQIHKEHGKKWRQY